MLDRPGLLLNPWALRDTEAQAETLAGSTSYGSTGSAVQQSIAAAKEAPLAAGEPPEGYASLDFLKQPAVVLLNLVPDKDGHIRIPNAELKGKSLLRILAVDPLTTVLKNVALEDTPIETRELRFAGGLDPAKSYSEQKLITPVTAKGSLAIADAATSRFELCDTVTKAYRLLATLGGNPTFEEFSFVANWPDLSPAEKQSQYSKYACHELSFFLYHKDPEFFRAVIVPYLKNKKDKTFMDHWLLGDNLKDYLEPWRFGRLNIVEQILLSKHLPDQQESVTREVRDRADLIPPNPEDFNRRFDTAVQLGAVETEGGVRVLLEDLRRTEEESKSERELGLNANKPTALAAAVYARPMSQAAGDRLDVAGKALRAPAETALRRRAGGGVGGPSGGGMLGGRGGQADQKEALADAPALFFNAEGANRDQARRFFQKLDRTKEWAEDNYYHLPIEQQLADLVTVNDFWADYAQHAGDGPFLSQAFPQATRNFTEMMLALAVMDLPFKAGQHQEKLERDPLHTRSWLAAHPLSSGDPRGPQGR